VRRRRSGQPPSGSLLDSSHTAGALLFLRHLQSLKGLEGVPGFDRSSQSAEGVFLRFNIDFFNVFNMPGTVLPDATTGIVSNQFSNNSPRVLQVTGQLTW
jgi:hypothetical protein